ncbi:MAG: hypothetical protein HOQ37_11835, partial [Cupriavidus sp.]|nr:hypothetical protein [Cupriavidus sp.]
MTPPASTGSSTPAGRQAGQLPGHELDALLGGRHPDPFGVLGPHPDGDATLVRACLPGAASVQLADAG